MSIKSFFKDFLGPAAPIIGAALGIRATRRASQEANRQASELASQGVRMRVEDARAAGIHPAAALGMQPVQAPAAFIGDPGFAELGQNISRAAEATSSKTERALRTRLLESQVTNQELQNDVLRTQIHQSASVGPSLPSPLDHTDPILGELGQGDGVFLQPHRITAAQRGQPAKEAGAITDYGFARTPTGYTPVPSGDVKQRIEDNIIPETLWSMRNLLLPSVNKAPPKKFLPKGANGWRWHFFKQEWQPAYPKDRKWFRDTRN